MSNPHTHIKCSCQLCVPDWHLVAGEFRWPTEEVVPQKVRHEDDKTENRTRQLIVPSPVPVILNLAA